VTDAAAGEGTPRPLEGKVALVTGASRRIGRAIAIALGKQGAGVVAHDRIIQEAETVRLCDELTGCGGKSWKVIADLERPEDYESLIGRAVQAAGALDILINNASIFQPNTLTDVSFGDVMRHVHVNAWAPFVLSREFARLAGRGKIINILDTKISGVDPDHVAYILSKRMLATLTRLCAQEFAPAITVNGVAPGLILPPAGRDESYLQQLAQTLPLKRHGGPGDVIDAVLFLLRSDFITGQVIFVDGGRHLQEDGHGPDTDQ